MLLLLSWRVVPDPPRVLKSVHFKSLTLEVQFVSPPDVPKRRGYFQPADVVIEIRNLCLEHVNLNGRMRFYNEHRTCPVIVQSECRPTVSGPTRVVMCAHGAPPPSESVRPRAARGQTVFARRAAFHPASSSRTVAIRLFGRAAR